MTLKANINGKCTFSFYDNAGEIGLFEAFLFDFFFAFYSKRSQFWW